MLGSLWVSGTNWLRSCDSAVTRESGIMLSFGASRLVTVRPLNGPVSATDGLRLYSNVTERIPTEK